MMFSPKEAAGMPMETRLGRTQMSTSSKLTIELINSMNELPPSNNFPLRTTEEVVTFGGVSEVPNTCAEGVPLKKANLPSFITIPSKNGMPFEKPAKEVQGEGRDSETVQDQGLPVDGRVQKTLIFETPCRTK